MTNSDHSLINAVERNNFELVDELLKAGADLEAEYFGETALSSIQSREMGLKLLAAGADPQHLSFEGRRLLVGLKTQTSLDDLDVTLAEFRQGRTRRFGTANPERFHYKFWVSMIRAGITGYQAEVDKVPPVWCAQRFGQSLSILPDNRIIQVGGEHEDYYDPDFCIYNDVFVHHPEGGIEIFGYPPEVFPPTDFHTANLLDDGSIWIIGSLGYSGTRIFGKTPVYQLNTITMRMEQIETTGENPGWIHRHRTVLLSDGQLMISGGLIATLIDNKEVHTPNNRMFVLDLITKRWRVVT